MIISWLKWIFIKINHLGKNPIIGGIPPKERREQKMMNFDEVGVKELEMDVVYFIESELREEIMNTIMIE